MALSKTFAAIAISLAGLMAAPASASANGTIIIYRPPASWFGAGENPQIAVDGKSVGRLGRGKMIRVSVKPGRHTVKATVTVLFMPLGIRDQVAVNVSDKGTAYVRVVQSVADVIVTPSPVVTHRVKVAAVSAKTAQAEMKAKR